MIAPGSLCGDFLSRPAWVRVFSSRIGAETLRIGADFVGAPFEHQLAFSFILFFVKSVLGLVPHRSGRRCRGIHWVTQAFGSPRTSAAFRCWAQWFDDALCVVIAILEPCHGRPGCPRHLKLFQSPRLRLASTSSAAFASCSMATSPTCTGSRKVLNQAVSRNEVRFPLDFAFQITALEVTNLMSQSVTSSLHGGRRKPVRVFTEQGVAMLSSVLKSRRAIDVNIAIMRAFVHVRELLASHKDLARRIDELEQRYDGNFAEVFDAIRRLTAPPAEPRPRIGFEAPRSPAKARRT
jgi:hypothetical protein